MTIARLFTSSLAGHADKPGWPQWSTIASLAEISLDVASLNDIKILSLFSFLSLRIPGEGSSLPALGHCCYFALFAAQVLLSVSQPSENPTSGHSSTTVVSTQSASTSAGTSLQLNVSATPSDPLDISNISGFYGPRAGAEENLCYLSVASCGYCIFSSLTRSSIQGVVH